MGEMTNWYGSIAGIAAAAVACGGAVRAWLGDKAPWNGVPLVVYVLLSCIGLSAVAQYVMHVDLAPSFAQLLVMAGTACIVAVGGVSFVTNVVKPLADTVDKNRLGVLLLVGLMAATGAACASHADGTAVSPEGTLALRANQFVQALRATVQPPGASPIEQLVASKVITANDGIQVAGAVKVAMQGGQDLAAALALVDNAKTASERQAGLARAAVLVQSIARGLETAKISVLTPEGRAAVVTVLQTASSLLMTVGSLFPVPTAGGAGGAAFAFGGADQAATFAAAFAVHGGASGRW